MRELLRFPGGKPKAVTISYDDGVQQDIEMIELMRKYGIKGTFNLNSARFIDRSFKYPEGKIWRAMVDDDVVPTYDPEICSVASHSAHHPLLTHMTEAEIADEIISDRRALEKRFGRIITGFAIPNGPYDDKTVKVAKLCGITYMRTAGESHSYEFPWETMPFVPTCSHNDPELMSITEKFLADYPKEDAYLLYVWGHTYTFEGENNWYIIKNFFDLVSGKDNIWYATNDEIFNYAEKYKLLTHSADGKIIGNPTDTDIWISAGGKTVMIPAGGSVNL